MTTVTQAEPDELFEEKTALPLELFFDLVFVFAITRTHRNSSTEAAPQRTSDAPG